MKWVGATVYWCRIWVSCKSSLSSGWSGWLVERLSSTPGSWTPWDIWTTQVAPNGPVSAFSGSAVEYQRARLFFFFFLTAYSGIFAQLSLTSVSKQWFYHLAGASGGRILGKLWRRSWLEQRRSLLCMQPSWIMIINTCIFYTNQAIPQLLINV